jgi:hypothetical protein
MLALVTQKSGSAQTNESPQMLVDRVIHRALNRDYTTTNGVRKISWVPPSAEDFAEIKSLGEKAEIPLSLYIDDKSDFVQLLAITFIDSLEHQSTNTLSPLTRIASDGHRWVVVRLASMDVLERTHSPEGLAVIKSMQDDSDPMVSRRAREILIRKSPTQ